MTRYFFNIRDNRKYVQDDEGVELSDLNEAISEAQLAIREMLAEMVLNGESIDGQIFEITDNTGTILSKVPWRTELRLED